MKTKKILSTLKKIDKKYLGDFLTKQYSKLQDNPNGIAVDITGICNLDCEMCSLKEWYPKNISKTIPETILEKIYEVVPKIRSISLMNNCEPLINKNIIQIIRTLKKIKPSIHISFVTNGMLLNPTLSSELIDAGADLISFSIDGATAETNDKIRKGGKFSKLIKNINNLNELKKEKKSNIPKLGTVTVTSTENINELKGIVELASTLNVETMNFNGLEPYNLDMENKKLWGVSANPEYENVYNELIKTAKEKEIHINLPSLIPKEFNSCVLVDCVIDANGDVYPCSSLSYQRQYYFMGEQAMFPRISFGNLTEKSFYDIWNSKDYKNFREKVSNGEFPEYCKKCLFKRNVTCAV